MSEEHSIGDFINGGYYDEVRRDGKNEGYKNGYDDWFQAGYRQAKDAEIKVKVGCPHCNYDLEYTFAHVGIKEVDCPNPRCGKSFSVILSVEAIDFSKPIDKK